MGNLPAAKRLLDFEEVGFVAGRENDREGSLGEIAGAGLAGCMDHLGD